MIIDRNRLPELLDEYFPYRVKHPGGLLNCFSIRFVEDTAMQERFGQFASEQNDIITIDINAKWDFYSGDFRFKDAADAIFFKLKYS